MRDDQHSAALPPASILETVQHFRPLLLNNDRRREREMFTGAGQERGTMKKRKTFDAPCPRCGVPVLGKVGDHCLCGAVLRPSKK